MTEDRSVSGARWMMVLAASLLVLTIAASF
jgi:hypothetical protein